ncbi:unnamed protein product [Parascedosporium putredinis]|uniref:Cytochrome P450 n=1 Tax=Parascedosporium putredinis TaxID=1442378 RepID=A0A9P1GVD9_9PEZI|nr:unnamed protein product [Parascedosporium putredinis]CAI7988082.1 unnamed protein product [Parascedosporium putredinis]
MLRHVDKLILVMGDVQAREGCIDLGQMLSYLTFDIIAELTFGESLNLLGDPTHAPWLHGLHHGLKFIVIRAILLELPILGSLLEVATTGPLKRKMYEHYQYSRALVDKRFSFTGTGPEDLWKLALRHEHDGRGLTLEERHANAAMFLLAGSETTQTTLSGTIYHLLMNKPAHTRLNNEIRTAFQHGGQISISGVSRLPYIKAVMQEGLRVYPPGGVAIGRYVTKGGIVACGHYLPEGVGFKANRSRKPEIMHRSSSYTVGARRANSTTDSLAWAEMSLALAKLVWHADLDLCPGMENWLDQKCYLSWVTGPLLVKAHKVRHKVRQVG